MLWFSESIVMTTEEEVRRWLAGRLKIPDVPAATWQMLVQDHYVAEVLRDEDGAHDAIVQRAGLLRRAGRPKHPGRSRTARSAELLPVTPAEREYAENVSAALAAHLGAQPPIRSFRGSYLDGRLLSDDGAEEFVRHSSNAQNLRAVADWLRRAYPIRWKLPDDAERFILTGRIRALHAVELSGGLTIGPLEPIRLTVMPFVSARTVERAYRAVQRRVIGRDNRRVGARNLALLCFVTARRADGNGAPRWEAWRAEWNREHRRRPAWRFDDRSAFRRAFLRGERAFLPRSALDVFFPVRGDGTAVESVRRRAARRRATAEVSRPS
jgi:hypothetical protein